jgi:hypothetical protein
MEWPLDSIRAAAEEERRHAIPAETEAMRKTRAVANKALAAGTRALLYGSVAAAAGVVGGGFVASAALDVRSSDDLRALLQRVAGPSVERARRSLAPWREWGGWGGGWGGGGGGGGGGRGVAVDRGEHRGQGLAEEIPDAATGRGAE